ncbi:melanocortin receptor 4-like [Mizuhopecten yessoensis]|uniref:Sphingosine 1-phosphate receptor 1 n=1 Tax=Mizuhopecten yessoensis TaxID=6573 RepID=A0A210Q049_MIZYE|nr:melanocortin receptor 4-like [Mizuhopecten yessoensis]XP_021370785.1 melanocortin receptor 4-like [Mizuhopecten yessoensis]XP_021370786.1 melanocortin receptor 4-like [Mizuhopecten yessoensis]XP_021370787.1 melanocortin receptor 4-like [Mizuhopecten yessoensis]OWF42102.1 Sphingosine 1-phosphate receptor 1 [Mizuhopecten yessoensis]
MVIMNVTATPLVTFFNTTDPSLLTQFSNVINATSWTNFKPQTLHERAEVILTQPETILILVLSFLALLLNTLSISATANIPHGLTTHSKLIISLAVSDILVTFSVFFHVLNKVFNLAKFPPVLNPDERLTSSCMFALINGLNTMAHLISLLNLLAMAIDHYIGVLWPLYYHTILSQIKGNIMIALLWILAFIGGFCNFLTGVSSHKDYVRFLNYCEVIMYNDFHGEYLIMAFTFICLVSISFIYIRIYCEVRTINSRLTYLQKDSFHNNKSMITTLLIIGTFILCYLPTCIFQIAMVIQIHVNRDMVQKLFSTLLRANKYLYALLLLNSVCDPIIYAVRLRDVQKGYYRLLSRCFKCYAIKIKEEWQNSYLDRRNTRTKSSIVELDDGDSGEDCEPIDELITDKANKDHDIEMSTISSGTRFLINGKFQEQEQIS